MLIFLRVAFYVSSTFVTEMEKQSFRMVSPIFPSAHQNHQAAKKNNKNNADSNKNIVTK